MSGQIGPRYRLLPTTTDMVFYVDASHALQYVDSYIWPDLSGNNNNGILYNSPIYNMISPPYYYFNGNYNTYGNLGVGSIGSDSSDYTWTIWWNPQSSNQNYFLARGRDGAGDGWNLLTGTYSNKINCAVTINITNPITGYPYTTYLAESTSTLVLNRWVNITGTYSKDNFIKIYINGVLEATTALPSGYTLRPSIDGWCLASVNTSAVFGNGYMGLAAAYHRTFNDSEVQQIFNLTRNRFGL